MGAKWYLLMWHGHNYVIHIIMKLATVRSLCEIAVSPQQKSVIECFLLQPAGSYLMFNEELIKFLPSPVYTSAHSSRFLFSMQTVGVLSHQLCEMWYLGEIEGVEWELLSLLEGHDLDEESPGWVVAVGNGIEQVSNGIIGVGGGQAVGLLDGQILNSLIGLKTTSGRQDTWSKRAQQTSRQMFLRAQNRPCSGTCSRRAHRQH